jgi:uncharacterized membrane protein
VIAIGPTFASLVAASFDQIRTSAQGNVAIMLRMLGALQTIASLTSNPGRRRVLGDQVKHIAELADRSLESPHERARFENRLARVREALEMEPILFAGTKKGESLPFENHGMNDPFHLKTRFTGKR